MELVMLWVASLPSWVIDMASVREGISSGDSMGETEAGVATASLASVELRISDSFIKEFTTVSLCEKQSMNRMVTSSLHTGPYILQCEISVNNSSLKI